MNKIDLTKKSHIAKKISKNSAYGKFGAAPVVASSEDGSVIGDIAETVLDVVTAEAVGDIVGGHRRLVRSTRQHRFQLMNKDEEDFGGGWFIALAALLGFVLAFFGGLWWLSS
jgi:hypothetical protein